MPGPSTSIVDAARARSLASPGPGWGLTLEGLQRSMTFQLTITASISLSLHSFGFHRLSGASQKFSKSTGGAGLPFQTSSVFAELSVVRSTLPLAESAGVCVFGLDDGLEADVDVDWSLARKD
jgi:hypothetical protein